VNVLVLCDDYYHPAAVPRCGLQDLAARGFHFVWVEDAGAWSPRLMGLFPAVILAKSNNVSARNRDAWMTPRVEEAFVAWVAQGGGLLALHSGTADYQETPALRALLGGVFVRHPAQCPVSVTPLPGHPLTEGSVPFTLRDEHYHMAMGEAAVDVFVTTTSSHGEQPGGWTRSEGRGRVAVLTPGHNVDVWLHPSYQALVLNALRWVAPGEQAR
jgi:type 1 glutamine amidotransferase